jgi:hypothetical protein
MGNRTYLIESESEKSLTTPEATEHALAAGKNCIPVYWYSLFDESCICEKVITLNDGRLEKYPYLITSTLNAHKRLLSRRKSFDRFSLESSQRITEKWFAFVHGIKRPFIHIETAELWMLTGSPGCQDHIVNCLRAFESADNAAWEEILDASQIDFHAIGSSIPGFKLAGFSWGGPPVPWE